MKHENKQNKRELYDYKQIVLLVALARARPFRVAHMEEVGPHRITSDRNTEKNCEYELLQLQMKLL